MSKNRDRYLCEIDGKPASVFLDLGIADEAPIERLPVVGAVAHARSGWRSICWG